MGRDQIVPYTEGINACALFEQVRASLPPSSKADIRAELEAFEAKVKGLVN